MDFGNMEGRMKDALIVSAVRTLSAKRRTERCARRVPTKWLQS